ncbi:thiosulfate oxidation carrier protein SoxY [Pseudoduganella aquatica]|uniref:Thiosulfate oxidation carrier protein SoxY n=1 Tax=Pseudoduganella aquatica TaxID=2660641 RepID=A0A7X4HCU3_9BURK|nr:thiosulfate oxidation carrier protein SoxY [Pseudoduganella aquatica]MYN08820.1 thiosulfate oxidation carrier protein SoxY [Pseudoduganella aquatica]
MNQNRRDALRIASIFGLAVTAGLLKPSDVFAADWQASMFDAKSLDAALKAMGGDSFSASTDVAITGPDIAENGAVVPVSVSSNVPNTEMIAILVEKNPNPLSASFKIPAGTEAAVSTRVKMGSTSNVHALVKADGKWFVASKEIKVTLGGCGG